MTELHCIVSGRVHGVSYRRFVQREAEKLSLCGTVQNLPDGTVNIVAQGSRGSCEALVAALRKGPPFSHVDRVAVEEKEIATLSYADFKIIWQ